MIGYAGILRSLWLTEWFVFVPILDLGLCISSHNIASIVSMVDLQLLWRELGKMAKHGCI